MNFVRHRLNLAQMYSPGDPALVRAHSRSHVVEASQRLVDTDARSCRWRWVAGVNTGSYPCEDPPPIYPRDNDNAPIGGHEESILAAFNRGGHRMSMSEKIYPIQHIGGTILVVMMEVNPAHEEDFHRW